MNHRKSAWAFALAVSFVSSLAAAPAPAPRPEGATVQGRIAFRGDPPRRRRIQMGADPVCAGHHTEPVLSERVIVNENGTLRNVFVYVKRGLEGRTFEAPAEPVQIDQNGCMYSPHVFGIQVGQALVVHNSDALLHNIHMTSQANGEWNFGQPSAGIENRQTFRVPEVMVRFACDVHSWMEAFAGVLPHPYFAVTGEEGTFALPNLPAGHYAIAAWHEVYGAQEQEVDVGEDGTVEVEFTFEPAP